MTSVTQCSNVTKTESIVLIKNMIRISISSICYFRDLFPSDCYKNKQYGTVNIHQLQGAQLDPKSGELNVLNQEAFLVTQWLERGIFAALESEYLSCMVFAIYTQHPKTSEDLLLESYEFKITYGGPGKAARINSTDISKESVKNQAAKFIRSLTEFASTLDNLPSCRWITIQLKYVDNAPKEYEPEFFGPSAASILQGLKLPLTINVGELAMPEMELKLKYAGMESLLEEDLSKVGTMAADVVQQSAFQGTSNAKDETSLRTTQLCERLHEPSELFRQMDISSAVKNTAAIQKEEQKKSCRSSMSMKEKVKRFIVDERCPVLSKCVARLRIGLDECREIFLQLAEAFRSEGVVQKVGNRFIMALSKSTATAIVSENASSAQQLQDTEENTVMETFEHFPPGNQATIPLSAAVTASKRSAVPLALKAKPTITDDYYDLSQSSDAEARRLKRRKYSLVKEPLRQGRLLPKIAR